MSFSPTHPSIILRAVQAPEICVEMDEKTAILALLTSPGVGYVTVNRALAVAQSTGKAVTELLELNTRQLLDLVPPGLESVAGDVARCGIIHRDRAGRLLRRLRPPRPLRAGSSRGGSPGKALAPVRTRRRHGARELVRGSAGRSPSSREALPLGIETPGRRRHGPSGHCGAATPLRGSPRPPCALPPPPPPPPSRWPS